MWGEGVGGGRGLGSGYGVGDAGFSEDEGALVVVALNWDGEGGGGEVLDGVVWARGGNDLISFVAGQLRNFCSWCFVTDLSILLYVLSF